MANCIRAVFSAIADARNEEELQQAVMDTVAEHFGVQRWGIYLLDDPSPTDSLSRSLMLSNTDNSLSQSLALLNPTQDVVDVQTVPGVCIESNPVGQYVVERHAPAHEQLILPGGDWNQFCDRDDHAHVMSGPIVCDGRLVGTLNLARAKGNPPFDANDLADLSALCLHLSAKLAILRAKPKSSNSGLVNRLTPRELEIATLVAQGLTNSEIGEKLFITQNSVKQALKRMFRKLEVSARAEMVAKLQDFQD